MIPTTTLRWSLVFKILTLATAYALPQSGNDGDTSKVLIGDLVKGITTPIGQTIANILVGDETGQSSAIGTPPPASQGTVAACKMSTDKCCIWYAISAELTTAFTGRTGRCNDLARAAIRLGFHDAGTWSQSLAAAGQDFGGADGSFVLFNEITRSENRGLESILAFIVPLQKKYGVGMGDLIQYMSNHAVVTCPLGPRVRTFIGRQDATKASPNGLLPSVSSDASTLIALFADKTISAHDMTALVGAHTTSKQFFVNLSQTGKPQDSTPGIWDVNFYNETLQPKAYPGTFRLASDPTIAADSRCSDEWNAFIGDQSHWNEDYATSYVRLSLLGVNVINNLTECSMTLPAARSSFPGSTTPLIDG